MKSLKITIVLIGYCITSMMYASQAQQKTKEAAAATSSSSSSSASASASGSSLSSAAAQTKVDQGLPKALAVVEEFLAKKKGFIRIAKIPVLKRIDENAANVVKKSSSSSSKSSSSSSSSSAAKTQTDQGSENAWPTEIAALEITIFSGARRTFKQAYSQYWINDGHKGLVYQAALKALDKQLIRFDNIDNEAKKLKFERDRADFYNKVAKYCSAYVQLHKKFESEEFIAATRGMIKKLFDELAKKITIKSALEYTQLRGLHQHAIDRELLSVVQKTEISAERVKMLLDEDANVNYSAYGETPLLGAVRNKNEEIIKLFIENGVCLMIRGKPVTKYIEKRKLTFKPEFLKYLAEQEKLQGIFA